MSLFYYSRHEVIPQEHSSGYGYTNTYPEERKKFPILFILLIVITFVICVGTGLKYFVSKKRAIRQLENRRNQLQDLEAAILNNANEFEIVPSYTENPNPQVDLGIYTSRGKLLLIPRPDPTYQPNAVNVDTFENSRDVRQLMLTSTERPPTYSSQITPLSSIDSIDQLFENSPVAETIDMETINSADTEISLPPSYPLN